MDSREMKKHILAFALRRFADTHMPQNNPRYVLSIMLDQDDVSEATVNRFTRVLRKMVENAEDKLK